MARPKFARYQPARIPSDLSKPGAGARVAGVLRDLVVWAKDVDAAFADSSSTVVTVASLPDEGNYFLLAGRSANQEAFGGASTTGYLWLQSSSGAVAANLARIQVTSTPDIIFDIPSGSVDPFQFSLGLASGTFTTRAVGHSLVGSGGTSSTWTLSNVSGAAATVPAKIIAHASQSGDAFVYYASDGSTVRFGVDADGDIYRQGGGTFDLTAGGFSFNINAGATDILFIGDTLEINRDDNAQPGNARLVIHASPAQSGDMLRIRNAADSANLAVFTSDGRLGIGGDPAGGLYLDVDGPSALRGDVTVDDGAVLVQMLGNNYALRLEGDSTVIGGNIFEVYDTSSATLLGYIDMSGVFTCPGGFAFNSGANIGFLTSAILSGTRTWTFPDASGTVMVTSGTETVTGARTYSGANAFTGATVLEVSAAADVRMRDGTTSSKLRFWDISSQSASTSRVAAMHDSSGQLVQAGNESVAATGTVTAGVLGYHASTGNTGSITATTLGNTVPAGRYVMHWHMVITTAGDAAPTDQITVDVTWNDGAARTGTQGAMNSAGAWVNSPLPVSSLNRVYSGQQTVIAAAGTNIAIATTLTNGGATNPAYSFYAWLVAN